ncbi:hypothetical protein ACQPYK_48785 (plasmid) [Streptosporangium sp. CA-135522]|uniref:hypothetical protein n=1 Tax=Streptosporangium sp. CA-135522 TaxID=3240072 RepID=UPI003D8FCE13
MDAAGVEKLAARRNKAADAYDRTLARAAAQYRTALDAQAEELAALYRQECVRYALTATAVVAAIAAGTDPVVVLDVDVAQVSEWPWLPEAPVTGLTEIDAGLAQRWRHAAGASQPRRSRKRPPPVELNPDGLETRLAAYAGSLAELVKDGKLARLMLRAPRQAEPVNHS